MNIKKHKCLGTGEAKGYGCSKLKYHFRYGLCESCFSNWLYNSKKGKALLSKTLKRAEKEIVKSHKVKRKYIKWIDKEFRDMVKYVQFEIVNPYIRERDKVNFGRCISSGNSIVDAGHYYPTTECKLRFSPHNIYGQNHSDNRFKGGNIHAFKEGIINRFGKKHFDELEKLKRDSHKWPKLDKVELIRIGKTYEYLTKNKTWCFRHEEFENYKELINK